MVQPLISVVAKKMKMSSNIVKRKREKEEPEDHCEEDRVRNFIPIPVILYCLTSMEKERWPPLALIVEYSGQTDIIGKYLNEHIAK